MKYELRKIDLENDFEVSNAIETLRDFANDPNKQGIKDLFRFLYGEFYQVWALKDRYVIERVERKKNKNCKINSNALLYRIILYIT